MYKTFSNWLALIGLAFFITACSQPAEYIALTGNTMGTTYHIKVAPSQQLPAKAELQAEIDKALEKVNDQMSTYRPHSELSVFNQQPKNEILSISPDTAKVIAEGLELYEKTDHTLNITIGPLVNLWGFGPDKRPTHIPEQSVIDAAKARMDISAIKLDGTNISKTKSDVYVDLSSIAKGFGVDKVAAILDKYQTKGYIVEIGGELSVKGTKYDGKPWRIAVEKPSDSAAGVQTVITPHNIAMATSGDYRNYYEEDGKRFSHIIDPRTGYPVEHRLASVTVLNASTMVADGYATAMMVLGTKASLALAEKEHLAIMLIEKQDSGFKVYYSDAFKPYLSH